MSGSPKSESTPIAPLTLRLLGDVGLYAADASGLVLAPSKPLALLTYLALTPGRRISREFLMDLLWADLEPERARNSLRQALFHLRKLLGENAIPGTEEITLARQIDTDRDRFLSAVERGDLDDAVDLYTGPFLPDFGTPGGAAFERWADLERDRLKSTFLRSAELVVRRRLNESRVKDAQRLARRVRDEMPEVELSWRLLLESIIASRDFVAAAVEADALEKYAAAEEITLEATTRAAIARARQVTARPGDPADEFTLVAELTGREREFSLITAAWEAARAGQARHVHLTAPAGLGKTRLLRDAVARLRASGARVVDLRAVPGDRDIPFAFAGDLALALVALPGASGVAPASASTLIGLNPMLSSRLPGVADTATGDDALRRRIQALGDLMQSVAYEHPFILVVDDMHWIDAESYRVLEGLFGRRAGAHVLCLTASRPERRLTADDVTVLRLAPLSAPQVGSLVSALGSIPAAPTWARDFIAGLHAATRGSPLLVLETLRLALDEGVLQLAGTEWRCADESRLATLLRDAEALRQRVRGLNTDEGWMLLLLATMGTPMTTEALATTVARAVADVRTTLTSVERQGLITATEAGWIPAHDEIAEAIRETLDEPMRQAADRLIGQTLAGTAGDDHHRLLRGARLLVAVGDRDALATHYRRYVWLARTRHDARSNEQLAAELLAADGSAPEVAALVRTLPVAWRAGLWNRTRQLAVAAAALVLVVGVGAAMRRGTARDATIPRLVYADSTGSAQLIAVDPQSFDGTATPFRSERGESPFLAGALAFTEFPPTVSPGGDAAAWNQDSGDSTTLDIWIRAKSGTRRLTSQARDDVVHSWLPDGSAVIGMTNRWTTRAAGNYDIAIFDTATGAARQVTSGPEHDGNPEVSPDGTRIAFTRESHDKPIQLCVVPFDGRDAPVCRLMGADPIAAIVGWSSLTEIIVISDHGDTRVLERYDWESGQRVLLRGPYVTRALLGPDRRSIVTAARTEGIRGYRDWIVPVDRPNNARLVDRPNKAGSAIRWWEGRADHSLLVSRIEFTDTVHAILPGIGTRVGIRALSPSGTEVPLRAPVRWTSSDTRVATVDSLGDVHPHALGTFVITASLAGWRSTSRTLEVRGAPVIAMADERWTESWHRRWITFGDPQPVVVTGPGEIRGMWNHGDGDYHSLAVLRRAIPAKDGVGVEVRVSTPITRDDWQRLSVILLPGVDTIALQRSDQRKSAVGAGEVAGGCGIRYPSGLGEFGRSRLAISGGGDAVADLGEASRSIRSGAWWTMRVQLFPDGRCGVAINGKAIWLSKERVSLDSDFWLRLGDESLGTTLVHGPLQLWTGVRTDLDWSRVPPG